jgi:hypothetical protein
MAVNSQLEFSLNKIKNSTNQNNKTTNESPQKIEKTQIGQQLFKFFKL